MKKLPLYAKILIGMGLGILLGFVALWLGGEKIVKDWVAPWGTIFIRLLKLIAVPLVMVSLIKGIGNMKDIRRLSRLGLKTLGIYVVTTIFAVVVGLVFASVIKPGAVFPRDKAAGYAHVGDLTQSEAAATAAKESTPMSFIVDIVPENVFSAAGDNTKMLQVIFVAILFGVAMVALGGKKVQPVMDLVEGLNEIILKVIHYIMLFAPWGVLALMADLVVGFGGDGGIFAALGMYALTLVLALGFIMFVFYPVLIRLFTKIKPGRFLKKAFPAQLVAFLTSSSAATLAVTMEQADELGVSKSTSSFVLPVGVTINMDGTSCYQAVAVLFIAQVIGLDLSLAQLLTITGVATLSSIGIPGGSIVMLIIVLGSVGIPPEWLALILGIDRPLDMLRTVTNITGDLTVACIVDKDGIA